MKWPIFKDESEYKNKGGLIRRIISLASQGNQKDAERLSKNLDYGFFKLFENDKDKKIYNKIKFLFKKKKFKDAGNLIKRLEDKGHKIVLTRDELKMGSRLNP